MRTEQIIKAAIPDATPELCGYIVWNRTPFPFELDARMLYKAASTFRRASEKGRTLCDFCDNEANTGYCCNSCRQRLNPPSDSPAWAKAQGYIQPIYS